MTLICSKSKIPTCMLHIPPRPKFSSVLLYDGPIFGRVHPTVSTTLSTQAWYSHVHMVLIVINVGGAYMYIPTSVSTAHSHLANYQGSKINKCIMAETLISCPLAQLALDITRLQHTIPHHFYVGHTYIDLFCRK